MAGIKGIKLKLLVVIAIALSAGISSFYYARSINALQWLQVLAGLLCGLSLIVAVVSLWMMTMRISSGHTLLSAYMHLMFEILFVIIGNLKMRRLVRSWKNPRIEQEERLRKFLQMNRDTVYAKEYGLGSVTSLQDLRMKHVLTYYEWYRPYVDRMVKGERGILTNDQLVRFTLTSGTTGKAKILPCTKTFLAETWSIFSSLTKFAVRNSFGSRVGLKKEILFYTQPKPRHTDDGTTMGPVSMIPSSLRPLLVTFATPGNGYGITDPSESVYVHLLFGLRDRDIRAMNTGFTSNLMSAMRQLEECWPDIVRDIKDGTVSTERVPSEVHRKLERAMRGGDQDRASELKIEFEKGFDGIMKRVWPHLEYIQAMDSSDIKDVLLQSYAKSILIYGHVLASTEGFLAYNLWPKETGRDEFVLMPLSAVFEFIPEENMLEDQPNTLFIDELRVGGVYEMVVTQIFGIYRFRFGDVIRVNRYHYETPVIEFMYRAGQILNVHSEKLDQRTCKSAIESAARNWHVWKLRDYAVAESTLLSELVDSGKDHRPFYVIFLEPESTDECIKLSKTELLKVDEELCQHSFTYNSYREKGSIAPPVVHVVESGTFDRLHDFILDHSTTTANQYKVPRKLRTTETLKLMLDSSVLCCDLTH